MIDDDDIAWMDRIDMDAGDSTGFESNRCSKYFTKRRKQSKTKENGTDPVACRRFPKLGIVIDTRSHMILSCAQIKGLARM